MQEKSSSPLVGVEVSSSSEEKDSTPTFTRLCLGCDRPIPQARIKVMPAARFCVPCQERLGDVPPLRRLDDAGRDGEVQEIYFTSSSESLVRELHRRNRANSHTASTTREERNIRIAATTLATAVAVRERELGTQTT